MNKRIRVAAPAQHVIIYRLRQ
jgi:hypothetical protein